MLAIVTCQTCELPARFASSAADQGALDFDAAQFRTQCKKSCQSRNFDCPDLIQSIKMAVWSDSAESPEWFGADRDC
jgi:hypothetical protein